VREGAIVIDVGINRITLPDGTKKTVGDVDFEAVKRQSRLDHPRPRRRRPHDRRHAPEKHPPQRRRRCSSEFAKAVAGCAKHVHLKDYRVQWTSEGYRLIRCAIGDGVIPFAEIVEVFKDRAVTMALEIGALCARHIRLLNASWWKGYPTRTAESLARGLKAARVKTLPEAEDWRTPFEKGAAPQEIVEYEMGQLHRSAEYLKRLGLM
jgi:hypothetical protein